MALFGRKKTERQSEASASSQYAGMRVEVLSRQDQPIFAGRMSASWGGGLEIQPITVPPLDADKRYAVNLRGYQESAQLAVHMSAEIVPRAGGVWKVENLEISGKENDRSFFRQELVMEGEVVPFKQAGVYSEPCKIINVSAGGVCIQVDDNYRIGDKLLLRSNLFQAWNLTSLMCIVRRVTKRRIGYEYGCEFTDLTPATEDTISKAVTQIQLKRMRRE